MSRYPASVVPAAAGLPGQVPLSRFPLGGNSADLGGGRDAIQVVAFRSDEFGEVAGVPSLFLEAPLC